MLPTVHARHARLARADGRPMPSWRGLALAMLGPLRRLRPLAWAALVGLAGAGCGHAQSFDEGVLRKDGVAVRVGPVPPAWRRIRVDGADLAFRDDERSGSALFNVRCSQRDDDAPLSVLTDHLIMGTTEREFDAQDTVPFDAREALHTLLRAKLDGVPMQYDIYVMKKDGCLYDLVYVAPPGHFADGAADFEHFAIGLRTEPAPSAAETAATPSRDP
jgi:hypothetical protein